MRLWKAFWIGSSLGWISHWYSRRPANWRGNVTPPFVKPCAKKPAGCPRMELAATFGPLPRNSSPGKWTWSSQRRRVRGALRQRILAEAAEQLVELVVKDVDRAKSRRMAGRAA